MKNYLALLLTLLLLSSCNKDDSIDIESLKRPKVISYYEYFQLIRQIKYSYEDQRISVIDIINNPGKPFEQNIRYTFDYSSHAIEVQIYLVEVEELSLMNKTVYHYDGARLIRKDDFSPSELNQFNSGQIYQYQNGYLNRLIFQHNQNGEAKDYKNVELFYSGSTLTSKKEYTKHSNEWELLLFTEYKYENSCIYASQYSSVDSLLYAREILYFEDGQLIKSLLYHKDEPVYPHLNGEIEYEYTQGGYLANVYQDLKDSNVNIQFQYESGNSNLDLFRAPENEYKYASIPQLPYNWDCYWHY